MKAIIISETACEAVKDRLIADLTKAMEKREAQIKSGDMTGMAAEPGPAIGYHVITAFNALRDA